MSAQEEYVLVQRIVSVLFQRGHMMTRFTIEYLLRELTQHIEHMIDLNDATERNHLDEQVLLMQQLNEVNERRRMQEHLEQQAEYINQNQITGQQQNVIGQQQNIIGQQNITGQQQNINIIDMDVDEDDNESQQTSELDQSFIVQPFTVQPFTVNPPIYRRLYVPMINDQPVERSKIIARRKLEEPCPAECSVCQETPKYKDAVCTECNHYYCKGCWESWMNAEGSNKKCPTCRKDMPRVTTFKGRAPNRRNVV